MTNERVDCILINTIRAYESFLSVLLKHSLSEQVHVLVVAIGNAVTPSPILANHVVKLLGV